MPPEGLTVAVPLGLPHVLLVATVVNARAVGWVIVTLDVTVQLLPSVTVTMYTPAVRPVAVAVVCTGDVFHE